MSRPRPTPRSWLRRVAAATVLLVALAGCAGSVGAPTFDSGPSPSASPSARVTSGSLPSEPTTPTSTGTRGRNAPCRPLGPARRRVTLLPDLRVPSLRVPAYRFGRARVLVRGFTVPAQRVDGGCVVRYVAPGGCLGAVRITRANIPGATIPASVIPATRAPGGQPVPAKHFPAVSTPGVTAPGALAPQDCRARTGTTRRALTRSGVVREAASREGLTRPGDVRTRRCGSEGCVPEVRLDSVRLPAVDLPRVSAGGGRIASRPLRNNKELMVLTRDRRTAVVTPTRLLFAGAGSSLRSGVSSTLRAVAGRVRYNASGRRLVVEAHSDDTGSASYALRLSRRRARAVATWLAGNGFEQAVISTRGFGDTAPAGPRTSRRNSRVVVSVLERRR